MKKVLLSTIGLIFVVAIGFAHGGRWGNNSNNQADNRGYQGNINVIQQLMHDTKIKSENTTEGVKLNIELSSDEVHKVLKDELKFSKEGLAKYFNGVDIQLVEDGKNLAVTFSSTEESLIQRLQRSGSGLWYEYMQQNMYRLMHGQQGNGYMGHGHGMMGGYGHGMMGGYQNCPGAGFNNRNGAQESSYMVPGAETDNGLVM